MPLNECIAGPQGLGLLTAEQLRLAEEFGVLIDMERQQQEEGQAGRFGLLLQIFTKPLGDRSTIFIEIIQVC